MDNTIGPKPSSFVAPLKKGFNLVKNLVPPLPSQVRKNLEAIPNAPFKAVEKIADKIAVHIPEEFRHLKPVVQTKLANFGNPFGESSKTLSNATISKFLKSNPQFTDNDTINGETLAKFLLLPEYNECKALTPRNALRVLRHLEKNHSGNEDSLKKINEAKYIIKLTQFHQKNIQSDKSSPRRLVAVKIATRVLAVLGGAVTALGIITLNPFLTISGLAIGGTAMALSGIEKRAKENYDLLLAQTSGGIDEVQNVQTAQTKIKEYFEARDQVVDNAQENMSPLERFKRIFTGYSDLVKSALNAENSSLNKAYSELKETIDKIDLTKYEGLRGSFASIFIKTPPLRVTSESKDKFEQLTPNQQEVIRDHTKIYRSGIYRQDYHLLGCTLGLYGIYLVAHSLYQHKKHPR